MTDPLSDLVQQLRNSGPQLAREAADCIERLQRERDEALSAYHASMQLKAALVAEFDSERKQLERERDTASRAGIMVMEERDRLGRLLDEERTDNTRLRELLEEVRNSLNVYPTPARLLRRIDEALGPAQGTSEER